MRPIPALCHNMYELAVNKRDGYALFSFLQQDREATWHTGWLTFRGTPWESNNP